MIPFNIPARTGNEEQFVLDAMNFHTMSGNGKFTQRCEAWFEEYIPGSKCLLVTSCTHALEMAAILLDIQPGDEVIVPSFTFVSTANAFALRGARIVFCDVEADTMNMDMRHVEKLVSANTKAVVPVHYAGVSCDMDTLMTLAEKHGFKVVEDAAQCIGSYYQGQPVGSRGHMSTFSFHETKNVTSGGEGGMLVINDPDYADRAEIIREKGTNRTQFFQGKVDKYTWVDIGSSYLVGELSAAYLLAQLERYETINKARLASWNYYFHQLTPLAQQDFLRLPRVSSLAQHNAHLFHIKTRSAEERTQLLSYLRRQGVEAVFHYVPLHTSPMGKSLSPITSLLRVTEKESACLVRLPLYYSLTHEEIDMVVTKLADFYSARSHANERQVSGN